MPEAATTKTETKKEEKPAPTPEEIEEGRKAFMARMGFADAVETVVAEPKQPPKQEEEVKEPEPEKQKEEPDAKVEEEKKEPEVKEPAPAAAVTPGVERIEFDKAAAPDPVEQAAAKAAERIAAAIKPTEPTAPTPPQPETALTPRQERTLAIVREIQAGDPEYKDVPLVNQVMSFWQKEADYIAQWQRENPGRRFNKNEEEHSPFYAEAMPDYSDDAFEDARTRLEDKRIAQTEQALQSKVAELEHQTKMREEMPRIQERVHEDLSILAAEADPEIAKLVVKDGKPHLTAEAVAKMKEVDPIAHKVLSIESTRLQAVVGEMELMHAFPGQHKFDANKAVTLPNGEVIYPHREIDRFYTKLEDDLASRPSNSTLRAGKRFIRQADYLAKEKEIVDTSKTRQEAERRLKSELDDRAWCIDPRFFAQSYREVVAEKVRSELKDWRGVTKSNGAAATESTPEEKTEKVEKEETAKTSTKKSSPASLAQASDKTKAVDGTKAHLAERDAAIDSAMWGI